MIHRRLFIGTAFAAFSPAARTKAEALSFPLPGDTWRRDFDGAMAVVISIGNGNVEWKALGKTACHSVEEYRHRANAPDTRYVGRSPC